MLARLLERVQYHEPRDLLNQRTVSIFRLALRLLRPPAFGDIPVDADITCHLAMFVKEGDGVGLHEDRLSIFAAMEPFTARSQTHSHSFLGFRPFLLGEIETEDVR